MIPVAAENPAVLEHIVLEFLIKAAYKLSNRYDKLNSILVLVFGVIIGNLNENSRLVVCLCFYVAYEVVRKNGMVSFTINEECFGGDVVEMEHIIKPGPQIREWRVYITWLKSEDFLPVQTKIDVEPATIWAGNSYVELA